MIIQHRYRSPLGELLLASYGDSLCMCDWTGSRKHASNSHRISAGLAASFVEGTSPVIHEAVRQLEEYLHGSRQAFHIPLQLVGTPFQKAVWNTLLTIPFGTTVTYAEQALRMNSPKAVRAVAQANGSNAISIIVPCHRVIGANRQLTGYAGGLEAKHSLLKLEQIL